MSDVCWALVKNIFILLLSYIYEIFASYREKRIRILLSLSTNPRRPEIMLCIAVQMFSPFPCVFKEPKKKRQITRRQQAASWESPTCCWQEGQSEFTGCLAPGLGAVPAMGLGPPAHRFFTTRAEQTGTLQLSCLPFALIFTSFTFLSSFSILLIVFS